MVTITTRRRSRSARSTSDRLMGSLLVPAAVWPAVIVACAAPSREPPDHRAHRGRVAALVAAVALQQTEVVLTVVVLAVVALVGQLEEQDLAPAVGLGGHRGDRGGEQRAGAVVGEGGGPA